MLSSAILNSIINMFTHIHITYNINTALTVSARNQDRNPPSEISFGNLGNWSTCSAITPKVTVFYAFSCFHQSIDLNIWKNDRRNITKEHTQTSRDYRNQCNIYTDGLHTDCSSLWCKFIWFCTKPHNKCDCDIFWMTTINATNISAATILVLRLLCFSFTTFCTV